MDYRGCSLIEQYKDLTTSLSLLLVDTLSGKVNVIHTRYQRQDQEDD